EDPMLSALAAGIAHEVRNPLNALQINVRILEGELAELVPDRTAHVHAVVQQIARELTSLDDFVSEFLRYARPARLRLEPVAVRALLGDLAAFIAPECAKKGVALALALDAGPTVIQADSLQLKHAVLNLLLNALQATPSGGRVILTTEGRPGHLTIKVADT